MLQILFHPSNCYIYTSHQKVRLPITDARCCAGCVFNGLQGSESSGTGDAVVAQYSNLYFRSCVFRNLAEDRPPEDPGEWFLLKGAMRVAGLNGTFSLDNCTLSDLRGPTQIISNRGGALFSDNPLHQVRVDTAV